jgi:hypothetical protein
MATGETYDLGLEVRDDVEDVASLLHRRGVQGPDDRRGGRADDGKGKGGEMSEEHVGVVQR